MDNFKIYSVTDEYIDYLRIIEPNVYSNKVENRIHTRKYIGTVLEMNGYKYFVPMSSPKDTDYQMAGGNRVMLKQYLYVRMLQKLLIMQDFCINKKLLMKKLATLKLLWILKSWKRYVKIMKRIYERNVDAFRKEMYTQVVGHTPVDKIYEENGFISTDVFSTYRDGRQIGESAMVVIDSVSREFEKIEV